MKSNKSAFCSSFSKHRQRPCYDGWHCTIHLGWTLSFEVTGEHVCSDERDFETAILEAE